MKEELFDITIFKKHEVAIRAMFRKGMEERELEEMTRNLDPQTIGMWGLLIVDLNSPIKKPKKLELGEIDAGVNPNPNPSLGKSAERSISASNGNKIVSPYAANNWARELEFGESTNSEKDDLFVQKPNGHILSSAKIMDVESITPGENGSGGYPGKLTRYVLITCIVAAAGGLIFGYDIGITGGVTSMAPFLHEFFPSVYRKEELDHSTNQYCKFDSHMLTFFTSSLYLAALVASLFASYVTYKFGRRFSMIAGGFIFCFGALLNGLAIHIAMLIIGRILLGIGVGFATQSIPVYVSEMAPYKYRGSLNVCFQLAITIGIFLANLVNFGTNKMNKIGWRISLGCAAVPALIMIVSSIWVSETPNFLIEREKEGDAKRLLKRIRGVENVDKEFDDLVKASEDAKEVQHPWRNLLMRKYRPQLVLAILIPFFQQFTGMNMVMFYAPEIFKTIGFGHNASLASALITGGVNVLATFISIYGTDRWGRRNLFFWGGGVMFFFQVALAILIGSKFGISGAETELSKLYSMAIVICICIFVAAFACSWGPLGWLVPSEIFPLEIRSSGQSIVVVVNMLCTFLIGQFFLFCLCLLKYFLFIVFAFCVAGMSIFVYFFVPETKNIPIEEMSQVWSKHWYWRKYVVDEDNKYDFNMERV